MRQLLQRRGVADAHALLERAAQRQPQHERRGHAVGARTRRQHHRQRHHDASLDRGVQRPPHGVPSASGHTIGTSAAANVSARRFRGDGRACRLRASSPAAPAWRPARWERHALQRAGHGHRARGHPLARLERDGRRLAGEHAQVHLHRPRRRAASTGSTSSTSTVRGIPGVIIAGEVSVSAPFGAREHRPRRGSSSGASSRLAFARALASRYRPSVASISADVRRRSTRRGRWTIASRDSPHAANAPARRGDPSRACRRSACAAARPASGTPSRIITGVERRRGDPVELAHPLEPPVRRPRRTRPRRTGTATASSPSSRGAARR